MTTTTQTNQFVGRAAIVADRLCVALRQLDRQLTMGLDPLMRDAVHPSIRSRVSRGLAADEPLVALHRMPGPDGLRRVVHAAARAGAAQPALDQCEHAIVAYEKFCADEGISRQTLQAMLGGYLPEARKDAFKTSRQTAFKARSIIAGYSAEAMALTLFLFGGTRRGRCHVAVVRGCRGWHRLRTECAYAAHGYRVRDACDDLPGSAIAHTDLNGVPLVELGRAPLLEKFCSKPLPRFERVEIPHGCNYYLVSDDVGSRSSCTFFVGEILANSQMRWSADGDDAQRIAIESLVFSTPCKRALFDVFVERDIWDGAAPELELFNVVPQGPVNETNYALREHDRMEMGLELQNVVAAAAESSVAKQYGEVVGYTLSKIGRTADQFRGYRCEIAYPLFGTQAAMTFELPEAP